MPSIKLRSSDGETFEVDFEIAKASETIKAMLDDLGKDDEEQEILLSEVNSTILKKVIQWANYHQDDPPASENEENKAERTNYISSWDADFLKMDPETLSELIAAAHHLGIKGLIGIGCITVANMIKGQSTEKLRKILNIENDFTPREQEEIRKLMLLEEEENERWKEN